MNRQHFGRDLSAYLNDSMGLGIDPGAIYNVTYANREVKTIYRVGVIAKRVPHEIKRRA